MSRRRRTRAEWEVLVAASSKPGESLADFARRHHVHPNTLYRWRRRLTCQSSAVAGSPGTPAPTEPLDFLDVVVSDEPRPATPGFVVEFNELRVQVPVGFDAGELRRLVEALS